MDKPAELKEEKNNSETKEINPKDGYIVRIRGLPWSASKEDIVKFFEESAIKHGIQGIRLTMSREGRPSGEAYVELETEEDYKKAIAKDNEHLGSRYIEVFQASRDEMYWALQRCGLDGDEAFGDACVRLRGLPFGCSKEEIAQFFTGLEIVRNGITLPTDFQGRSTGEAYVQFATQEIAEKAMGKHKEKIGHRYIEIFKSSLLDIRSAVGMGPMRMRNMGSNRLSPYDRMERPAFGGYGMRGGRGMTGQRGSPIGGGYGNDRLGVYGRSREDYGTGHRVHMRGLPYKAVERDIYEFFAPLNPVSVHLKVERNGRAAGAADVEFSSHEEAVKAMDRDKDKIQHRYIELFLHSSPEPFRRGSDGFDGMGGGFSLGDDRQFGMERSFSSRARPFPGDGGERSFSADRGYGPGGGDRGFGAGAGNRGYTQGFGGSSERGFGFSGNERGYGPSRSPDGRSYGGSGERSMRSERSFGMSGATGNGEFRNGMSGTSGAYRRGESSYGGRGFGADGKEDSEFYGSGKLFGESNFSSSMSQGMNSMMGGSNYTSF